MSVFINPATRVISVPQSDLTLVSGTLYKMDTNAFRYNLMDLLANEDHIWMPDAYFHNTEQSVAGVTYARLIGIINGYSVEFLPDSQWSVILEGSNNDIWDIESSILVQNQVQVIPTNSAGLIVKEVSTGESITEQDKLDIADRVWDEQIADHVDVGSTGEKLDSIDSSAIPTPLTVSEIVAGVWAEDLTPYTTEGTAGQFQHDIGHIAKSIFINTESLTNGDGTAGNPFNNIDDAKTHAEDTGIKEIVTYAELTLNSAFKNFVVRGLAAPVVDTNNQDISGSEFYHCTLRGLYTGAKQIVAQECALDDGFQLTGYFENCVVTGTMNVVGGAVVKNCSSGTAGLNTPTFNMNSGLETSLSVRDWSGGILIQNCDHVNDVATLEVSQGRIFVDNTNTSGLISIRGLAFFDDTSAGTTIETSGLLDPSKSQLTQEEQDRLFETLTLKKYIGLK